MPVCYNMAEKKETKIEVEVEVNIETGGDRERKKRERQFLVPVKTWFLLFQRGSYNKMHILCRI